MEGLSQPVQAQSDGRETASAHASLRRLRCAGRQQDEQARLRSPRAGGRALRAPIRAGGIGLKAPYASDAVV